MAKRGVKKKEGENLTDNSIERVISLLEAEKPISKKEACEILNISYNPARLNKIILEYKDKIADIKKRRAANRGKPATDFEIQTIVESYLEGDNVAEISERLYRPADFVKKIIDKAGVPSKKAGEDYFKFSALPDNCVSEVFEPGEIVWSSRYQSAAEIVAECGMSADGLSKVYQIYVFESSKEPEVKFFNHWGKPGYYAHQCAYDLGRLTHLTEYGVDINRILRRNVAT